MFNQNIIKLQISHRKLFQVVLFTHFKQPLDMGIWNIARQAHNS